MRYTQYLVISCGSCHLAAAHLKMNASGRCDLVDYVIEEVSFESSDPLLWLKASSQRFKELKKRFKADLPVGFAIPGHLALTKYLKIPQVPIKKRQKIVSYEAKQNIPYPMGEVTWDDCLIEEDDLDFETVIVAAKTDLVEALSLYGRQSKMAPDVIEPAFVCLVNGFRFNYPEYLDSTLLVSIGAKSTDLIYFANGKYFSRNISFGGDSVTRELADALGLSFEDAEELKRRALSGDPVPTAEYSSFSLSSENFVRRLATEIARTTAISQRQGFDVAPKKCFITGGGSRLPSIQDSLSNRLGVDVEMYNPLRKVRGDLIANSANLNNDKALLSIPIGMAIGRFLPDAAMVDLLPRSIVWQRKFRKQQPYFLGAGLVACVAVCLPIFNAIVGIRTYEQEIQNLDTKVIPLLALDRKIADRLDGIEKLMSAIEKTSELSMTRSNWVLFLSDMQRRLSSVEDVWLDKLEVVRFEDERSNTIGGRLKSRRESEPSQPEAMLLRLGGRLIDVKNPMSTVSQDSFGRVKALLESFEGSRFVRSLENERFDNTHPGILIFNFTLVVEPATPL